MNATPWRRTHAHARALQRQREAMHEFLQLMGVHGAFLSWCQCIYARNTAAGTDGVASPVPDIDQYCRP